MESKVVALISCAKNKEDHTCEARSLYNSQLFKKAASWAENSYSHWFILSALYGLVGPNEQIAPYDQTLNTMTKVGRIKWAESVSQSVIKTGAIGVDIYAGKHYREYLVPMLEKIGIKVTIPLLGLGIGQQLAWYKNKEKK